MDVQLKEFLDKQDWEDLTNRLTLSAKSLMLKLGFVGRNARETQERAFDYALETAAQAYDACIKMRPGRFDLQRGNLDVLVEERFYAYLTFNILRRLVTDDMRKAKARSDMVLVPIEVAAPITKEIDDQAELSLAEMIDGCDAELEQLILGCVEQLQRNPDKRKINWTQLEADLKISRYKRDQLRPKLEEHLLAILEKRCHPTPP